MMKNKNSMKKIIVALCLLALFSQQVMAQSESGDDEWNHSLAVYLWGASISGTTASGTGIEVDFDTLTDNLEFAFMGFYQGRKGKWSMMADVIYLDLSHDKQFNVVPPVGPGTGLLSVLAYGFCHFGLWHLLFGERSLHRTQGK